jgi:hypothetical protein
VGTIDDELPSEKDLERWRETFDKATAEELTEANVEVSVVETHEDENYITFVKVGNEDYKPTLDDLEAWRSVFEDAIDDPDFKIFTHHAVTIEAIPIGKILTVEADARNKELDKLINIGKVLKVE